MPKATPTDLYVSAHVELNGALYAVHYGRRAGQLTDDQLLRIAAAADDLTATLREILDRPPEAPVVVAEAPEAVAA